MMEITPELIHTGLKLSRILFLMSESAFAVDWKYTTLLVLFDNEAASLFTNIKQKERYKTHRQASVSANSFHLQSTGQPMYRIECQTMFM